MCWEWGGGGGGVVFRGGCARNMLRVSVLPLLQSGVSCVPRIPERDRDRERELGVLYRKGKVSPRTVDPVASYVGAKYLHVSYGVVYHSFVFLDPRGRSEVKQERIRNG